MHTLEKLKARIYELVPETMEKQIGCRVEILDQDNFPYSTGFWISSTQIMMDGFHVGVYTPRPSHSIKILGRPITLADVIRAIGSNYYVRHDGTFFQWEKFTEGGDGHHGVKSTYVTWNLSEPLDSQIPAVHEFLLEIMKK